MTKITTTKEIRESRKPWGKEMMWALNEHYCGKILTVTSGQIFWVQFNKEKTQTFYVLTGVGFLTIENKERRIVSGDSFEVPKRVIAKMKASSVLVLIEVSTPERTSQYGRIEDGKR